MNKYLFNLINQSGPKNFGWIEPKQRTSEQKVLNLNLIQQMSEFKIEGDSYLPQDNEQSQIWECIRKINGGKNLKCLYQTVGSCVGQGKCNAEWQLSYVQVVLLGKREIPNLPYEPYGYAQSRVCAGISGNSDGSTGSGAAEAAKKYGVLDSRIADLPAYKENDDTIEFSGSIERQWGNRGAPSKYIPEGQKHLVKTTALIKTTVQAREALYNNFPITIASDWGGMMSPPLKGTPQVRLNSHSDTWMHQMEVSNFWNHPTLGLIFYVQNSWSPSAHPAGPNGEPLGGFWINEKDMQYIINQGETFAYSQFDGFPSNRIDPKLLLLI